MVVLSLEGATLEINRVKSLRASIHTQEMTHTTYGLAKAALMLVGCMQPGLPVTPLTHHDGAPRLEQIAIVPTAACSR